MIPIRYALLALTLAASAAMGAEIEGPDAVDPQRTIKLSAKVPPKTGIVWKVTPLDGQDDARTQWFTPAKKVSSIEFIGQLGRWKVTCTTLAIDADGTPDFEVAEKVVTFGTPVPPTPTDPLTKAFQDAYAGDADADRTKSLAFLAGAYKGMAAQAASRDDKTNAQFVAWMKTVIEAPAVGLTAGQLKKLRTAIGSELAGAWGTHPAPLSAADAAAELGKIATALGGVK